MANWKKLAVSGSATSFPQLSVDTSITASIFSGSQFIGSLTGTASYATNADTAISSSYAATSSWALNAINANTASYVNFAQSASLALTAENANTASYVNFAQSASYVLNAVSASRAASAANADTASYVTLAQTASYVENAQTASLALTAQNANTASYVTFAQSASLALTAENANTASYVNFAQSASYILNAVSASRAASAANADNATSASYALSSSYSSFALTASYVLDKTIVTGSNFIFSQPTPASTWVLNHYLNSQYPVFQVFNASNEVIVPTSITANSTVTATITFSVPTAGTAVASIGGFTGSAPTVASASYASTASFAQSGNGAFSGSFSGSFQGDGGGLTNIPASGIVGLQLNQIASGSATASIAPDLGFRVNTNSQITGSLIVSSNINSAGNVVATGANSSLTGSFTGSFAGNFVGTSNLPDLTQGSGVTTFTYDGSNTATVAVSGASTLSSNTVTKWSGDAFVNSSITDGANVTINNNGGVLVQAGGLYVTGASTFHDSVVMQANLTVNGTASFQNVQNLAVVDQFILLNSGSTTFQDSGIVINTGNSANSGSAFFLETAGTTTGTAALNGRFAVASGVLPDATSATAAEYAVTALISGSAPGVSVPQFGGTGLGQGNMWINTDTDELFIYF